MLDQIVDSSSWSKGKKRGFQNPTSHPLYLFSIPSLRLSFTGPYCSFVIMECRTPPTLKKELPISPAILLRSPSFFDMFQDLCGLTYPQQGNTECTSRYLVHWTGQVLVPNVGEHVILSFGANGHRGPYQSHSSVTAILWFISSRSIEINSAIHIVFSLYFCWALYYLPYLYHYRLRT